MATAGVLDEETTAKVLRQVSGVPEEWRARELGGCMFVRF